MKTLLSLVLFSGLAIAQPGSISTFNFGSQSPIRRVLPMGNAAPFVSVFIYDPVGSDKYEVTLSYVGTDGVARVVSQDVKSMGLNTFYDFQVDAATIVSVTANGLKANGVVLQGSE